jgi:hypothetical protein
LCIYKFYEIHKKSLLEATLGKDVENSTGAAMAPWSWLRRRGKRSGRARRPLEPVRIAEELRKYPGLWVAWRDGKVVEASQTPYELLMKLSEQNIKGATIMRAPDLTEPLRVGLG